jgi:two-component system cell cycle sensor histidine kinase/response regulator CckA
MAIFSTANETVVARSLGTGTQFRVLLPSVESEHTVNHQVEGEARAQGNGWVLLIDDEELVRNMTARMLQSLGYDVLTAGDAAEAMKKSREHAGAIDILLCDVAMPGRNGPSIAQDLLRERPTLRVIFASGYAPEIRDDLPYGALYLQKPFRRAELLAKLREVVAEPLAGA